MKYSKKERKWAAKKIAKLWLFKLLLGIVIILENAFIMFAYYLYWRNFTNYDAVHLIGVFMLIFISSSGISYSLYEYIRDLYTDNYMKKSKKEYKKRFKK